MDSPQQPISLLFAEAIAFMIWCKKSKGKILVHCQAGISRSVTLVAAFLLYTTSLTLENILYLIKSKRSCIQPNQGFINQLKTFEAYLKNNKKVLT